MIGKEGWEKYADIICLDHPDPKTHSRMSEMDRAAQFAPFSALTGYEAMVTEKARVTDKRIEPDEEQILQLNEALSAVLERVGVHPEISVVHFVCDKKKAGGRYVRSEGAVRDVDLISRKIIFRDGRVISMDDIFSISLKN